MSYNIKIHFLNNVWMLTKLAWQLSVQAMAMSQGSAVQAFPPHLPLIKCMCELGKWYWRTVCKQRSQVTITTYFVCDRSKTIIILLQCTNHSSFLLWRNQCHARGDRSTDCVEVSLRSDIRRIFTRSSRDFTEVRPGLAAGGAHLWEPCWIAGNWFRDLCRQDPVAIDVPSITSQQRSKQRRCHSGRRHSCPAGLTAGLEANPLRTLLPSILLFNVWNLHAVVVFFFLSFTILSHWKYFFSHCTVKCNSNDNIIKSKSKSLNDWA